LKLPLLLIIVGIFFIPLSFDQVFGDGEREALSFSGMDVTVITQLEPNDFLPGEIDRLNLSVRFFDATTNKNIEKVTYSIEITQGEQMLAQNLYYDIDGNLNIQIKPLSQCTEVKLLQCTKYFGSEHVSSPGAIYVQNEGRSLIQGPIFTQSGLYNISVKILGAITPTTLVGDELTFNTLIRIPQKQEFTIQTSDSQQHLVNVISYYDNIDNFKFDKSNNSFSFEMPFNWDHENIEKIGLVHTDILIPKSFEIFSQEENYVGFVNGIKIDKGILLKEPYSNQNSITIHLLINEQEIERINEIQNSSTQNYMKFELVPQSTIQQNSVEFYLVNPDNGQSVGTNVNVSWESEFIANNDIPFKMTFFDDNENILKKVRYVYTLIVQNTGNVLLENIGSDVNNLGIFAPEGIDFQTISIPSQDLYRLDVLVLGQGTNDFDFDSQHAGIGSGLIEVNIDVRAPKSTIFPTPVTTEIPGWIKNNAAWWADGQIDDDSFVQGIQFLIKEDIIRIPQTTTGQGLGSNEIPAWIKNNAAWWADGQIDDDSFVQGIQFLIKAGIMRVN